MTSAFGLNGVVLIYLVAQVAPEIPILFVDTGQTFPEVLKLRDRLIEAYGVNIHTIKANGPELPEPKTPNCCQMRKVEPMRRAIAELDPAALLTARGRFQAVTRRRLDVVEWDRDPVRVNPLAHWTQEDVEDFVKAHDIPYNPLYDQGYKSVGCVPCTRPLDNGEDIRAGRWDGLGKVECGLWE